MSNETTSTFEKKFDIQCQNHPKKQVSYLCVYKDKLGHIFVEQLCNMCALQNINPQKKLLIIEELIYQDDYTIITNWPFLDNPQIMMRFTQLYDDIQQNILTKKKQHEITNFFKRAKSELIQKIDEVENQLLHNLRYLNLESLMSVYNDISEKKSLKQSLNFFNFDINSFKNLLNKLYQNFNLNNEKIENIVHQFESFQSFINLEPLDLFFKYIQNKLNQFLVNEDLLSESIQNQKFNETFKNLDSNLQSQLKILNDQLSSFMTELPSNLKERQKYSFLVQSNKMKDQLDAIINDHLDTPVLSNKIKNAIMQKKIVSKQKDIIIEGCKIRNMYGNQFAYLDVEITKEDIGKCFGIQINKLSHWIGIGIVDRNQLIKNNFQFKSVFSDKICAAISNNGYAWSMHSEIQFKKEISFQFKTHDILSIMIMSDSILFENKTTRKQLKMDFVFSQDKKYYPGFRLFDKTDEIEFV